MSTDAEELKNQLTQSTQKANDEEAEKLKQAGNPELRHSADIIENRGVGSSASLGTSLGSRKHAQREIEDWADEQLAAQPEET